jgi:hypothetical protein
MQAQPIEKKTNMTVVSVTKDIYRAEGVRGFFRGLAPALLRSAPTNAAQVCTPMPVCTCLRVRVAYEGMCSGDRRSVSTPPPFPLHPHSHVSLSCPTRALYRQFMFFEVFYKVVVNFREELDF